MSCDSHMTRYCSCSLTPQGMSCDSHMTHMLTLTLWPHNACMSCDSHMTHMLTLTLWPHNACMSCDSHMTHLLTPSPLTSQCSAACQWTGRYSVLPPSSPSQGAWPLNLCVCSINWDTSRKSSTGGGIACMLLSLSQLHTCSVVYTQTCVHTRMHACTHVCTHAHTHARTHTQHTPQSTMLLKLRS